MRKRIHEDITRREMKQMITFIKPDLLEAFKNYCKATGTSMNKEIEKYITNVSKDYTKPQESFGKPSYAELIKSLQNEFEGFGTYKYFNIKKSPS
jgi:hypothetical protein